MQEHRVYHTWVADDDFDENGLLASEDLDELSAQGWEVVGVSFHRMATNMGTKQQKWGWTILALLRQAITDPGPLHAGVRPARGGRQRQP
jgi:hypothetical protein